MPGRYGEVASYDGSAPLRDARRERFAQNAVQKMSLADAARDAGYSMKSNRSLPTQIASREDVSKRMTWLMSQYVIEEGALERAKKRFAVLALTKASEAIETLKAVTLRDAAALASAGLEASKDVRVDEGGVSSRTESVGKDKPISDDEAMRLLEEKLRQRKEGLRLVA